MTKERLEIRGTGLKRHESETAALGYKSRLLGLHKAAGANTCSFWPMAVTSNLRFGNGLQHHCFTGSRSPVSLYHKSFQVLCGTSGQVYLVSLGIVKISNKCRFCV
jgi:hypothetical protein